MLFFIAARLELSPRDLARVISRMQAIGAQVDVEDLTLPAPKHQISA